MKKIKGLRIISDRDWTELREYIVERFEACRTEQEFSAVLQLILSSTGTAKELIKLRKELGIPITKEFLKQLKNDTQHLKGGKV